MGLSRRLEQLEAQVQRRDLWAHYERIATESGLSVQEIWERVRATSKALDRYRRAGMSNAQAVRAHALDVGLDPDEMLAEYKRLLEEHRAANE